MKEREAWVWASFGKTVSSNTKEIRAEPYFSFCSIATRLGLELRDVQEPSRLNNICFASGRYQQIVPCPYGPRCDCRSQHCSPSRSWFEASEEVTEARDKRYRTTVFLHYGHHDRCGIGLIELERARHYSKEQRVHSSTPTRIVLITSIYFRCKESLNMKRSTESKFGLVTEV